MKSLKYTFPVMIVLFAGCSLSPPERQTPDGPATRLTAERDAARALVGPGWPVATDRRLTTAGDIALANLDGQIAALESRLDRRPDERSLAALAEAVYHRFQLLGRLADAVRARTLLQGADPALRGPRLALAEARVLMGFHEFKGVARALDEARALGADDGDIANLQAALDRATGADGPGAMPPPSAEHTALNERATRAAALLDRGRATEATAELKQAQDTYHDTAPLPLAWVHLQQGIVFLRLDDPATARVFFAAAHERLPQYALATEHLAETELAPRRHGCTGRSGNRPATRNS